MTRQFDDILRGRLADALPVPDQLVHKLLRPDMRPSPRQHGHSERWIRNAAIAILLVVATVAASAHFAPRFDNVLANAPILGNVTGPVLRAVGLQGIVDDVTALSGSSTSSGYRIDLEGGYADGVRTVLLFKISPVGAIVTIARPDALQLTDQFGESYTSLGDYSNSQSGQCLVEFSPLSGVAGTLGAVLDLKLSELEHAATGVSIAGHWELSGTLWPQETNSLALPQPGAAGPLAVAFTGAVASPTAVSMDFLVSSASTTSDWSAIDSETRVTVRKPSGGWVAQVMLSMQGASGHVVWKRSEPGRYAITISFGNLGSLTRYLAVP